METRINRTLALLALLLFAPMAAAQPASKPEVKLPAKLFVNDAPKDAKPVGQVAAKAAAGESVTVRGTVPDEDGAFTPGQARFVIVDETGARALVVLADAKGEPMQADLRGRRGLNPGAEVVVQGKRGPGDGLTVLASGICVVKAALPPGLVLNEEPKDARRVEETRGKVKKGDTVAIRGRVGGSLHPFVDERAVFTIVGDGLKSCAERGGDDHCKTPWDYCCETRDDITAHSATVQLADPQGGVLRVGLKTGDVKELAEVIVVGTVASADAKSLIVNATGIYVVKK